MATCAPWQIKKRQARQINLWPLVGSGAALNCSQLFQPLRTRTHERIIFTIRRASSLILSPLPHLFSFPPPSQPQIILRAPAASGGAAARGAQGVAYNKGEFQRIMRLAQTPPPPLHIRSAASLGEQISNKESARRAGENGTGGNPLEYILISARPPRFYLFIFNQRSAEKSTAASRGGLRERVRAHHRACSIQYRNVCSLPAFDKRYYDGHCEGCQVKSSSHCCCCIMYI